MTPKEHAFLRKYSDTLFHTLIRPVASSLLYGISVALFAFVSFLFWKKRLRGRPTQVMASVAVMCFLLTTANFMSSALAITYQFNSLIMYGRSSSQSSALQIPPEAYDVYFLTQYCILAISDAIVVWRTQALYPDRPTLYRIPALILLSSSGCLIGAYAIERRLPGWPIMRDGSLSQAVDEIGQALSLFVNVLTTILVGIRLWSYHKWFSSHDSEQRDGFTQIRNKLLILFETGALFCIVQLITVAYTINVDFRTNKGLSCTSLCIFTNYALSRFRYAFAANYSIIVLVLVHSKSSFSGTVAFIFRDVECRTSCDGTSHQQVGPKESRVDM